MGGQGTEIPKSSPEEGVAVRRSSGDGTAAPGLGATIGPWAVWVCAGPAAGPGISIAGATRLSFSGSSLGFLGHQMCSI